MTSRLISSRILLSGLAIIVIAAWALVSQGVWFEHGGIKQTGLDNATPIGLTPRIAAINRAEMVGPRQALATQETTIVEAFDPARFSVPRQETHFNRAIKVGFAESAVSAPAGAALTEVSGETHATRRTAHARVAALPLGYSYATPGSLHGDRQHPLMNEADGLQSGHSFVFVAWLGITLLALGMWAMWRLTRRSAEPLRQLTHAMTMLGAGQLGHRVSYSRNDAYADVISAFNQMSDQLQRNVSRLQRSNTLQAKRLAEGARELIAQTSHDPLTGLATRARLHAFMGDAIESCGHCEEQFALLLIDLDGFKNINVSAGHAHGDRLLRVIARRLQGQIEEEDLAARVSGDEFCLVLKNVDVERTTEFSRRCLHALNAPIHLDGAVIRPRASIGITFYPGDAATPDDLLKAANMAMVAAKNAGKHRYALYETGMTQKAAHELALESALRVAVEQGQFELHYQPQIELASGRMTGIEALIRWPRPGHGLVPPDEFIAVAERLDLINAIGVWVLETACRQAVAWHQAGFPHLVIAVNISPGHFESPDFADTVARVLLVTGIAPQCLEIEVTESVTRDSLRHASISEALRQLGVRVAIDDFGTGYSSLAVLKKMPIDTLKLDRAFIRDMLEDSGSSMLIGTLIGMAKGLHLSTVAEGVETLEQVRVLTALGCPMAQGYYFSRPVTADLIPALADTDFLLRVAANQTAPFSI